METPGHDSGVAVMGTLPRPARLVTNVCPAAGCALTARVASASAASASASGARRSGAAARVPRAAAAACDMLAVRGAVRRARARGAGGARTPAGQVR
jgi:hypothetical protein